MKSPTTKNYSYTLAVLICLTLSAGALSAGDVRVRLRFNPPRIPTPPRLPTPPRIVIRRDQPTVRTHRDHPRSCSCCSSRRVDHHNRRTHDVRHRPIVQCPDRRYDYRDSYSRRRHYHNDSYSHRRHVESATDRAWRYLREGREAWALVLFRSETKRCSRETRNWVGYSLAAFETRYVMESVSAMRGAMLTSPKGVYGMRCGHSVRRNLENMRKAAMVLACGRRPSPAANFMVAATSYVLGDKRTATIYIQRALKAHDHDKSTMRLARELGVRSHCRCC